MAAVIIVVVIVAIIIVVVANYPVAAAIRTWIKAISVTFGTFY